MLPRVDVLARVRDFVSNPIGVTAPGSEDEEGEEQEESSVGAPRGTLERRVGALRIRTWSKTPPLARDLMMTLETYMMILETHRPVLDPPGASVTAFCTPTSRVSEHGIKQDMSIVERHFSSAPLANSCQPATIPNQPPVLWTLVCTTCSV